MNLLSNYVRLTEGVQPGFRTKHAFTSNTPWVNKWSIELSGVIDCTHRAKEFFRHWIRRATDCSPHTDVSFILLFPCFSLCVLRIVLLKNIHLRFQSQNASLWERATNVRHVVISQSFFFLCIMIWFPMRSFQMALLFIYTYFTVLSCELRLQREFNSVELFHASASPEKMLMCHQGG